MVTRLNLRRSAMQLQLGPVEFLEVSIGAPPPSSSPSFPSSASSSSASSSSASSFSASSSSDVFFSASVVFSRLPKTSKHCFLIGQWYISPTVPSVPSRRFPIERFNRWLRPTMGKVLSVARHFNPNYVNEIVAYALPKLISLTQWHSSIQLRKQQQEQTGKNKTPTYVRWIIDHRNEFDEQWKPSNW